MSKLKKWKKLLIDTLLQIIQELLSNQLEKYPINSKNYKVNIIFRKYRIIILNPLLLYNLP
jgi:hypothetical protein